ncbi:hypothetical protein LTR17_017499 [Elasticomyces elasticus]|nr:hypothetical protein LTR17_017499 [Elasticomyces elasticus]
MNGARDHAVPAEWLRILEDIEQVRRDPEYFFRAQNLPTLVDHDGDEHEQESLLRMMLGVQPGQYSQDADQVVNALMGRRVISANNGAQFLGHNGLGTQPAHAPQPTVASTAPQMHQAAPPPTDDAEDAEETPEPRMKGEFLRGRPAYHVQLPGGGVEVGMVELNTFFPACFLNPQAILRALRNGFSREQLAELQYDAVNQYDGTINTTAVNRLQQQISKAGKLEEPNRVGRWKTDEFVKRVGLQNDLTVAAWRQREQYGNGGSNGRWTHMSLVDIANCVPRAKWPVGNDRLYITACLEFAVANPGRNLTTAHWASIIQNDLPTFVLPAAPTGANENRDTEAHTRLFG